MSLQYEEDSWLPGELLEEDDEDESVASSVVTSAVSMERGCKLDLCILWCSNPAVRGLFCLLPSSSCVLEEKPFTPRVPSPPTRSNEEEGFCFG